VELGREILDQQLVDMNGVNMGKVDGIVLEDALLSPSSKGLDLQHARATELTPLIQALQQRSDQE
jgi:hypothetical protein